jgi:Tfp pilus assembly protein PilN
VRTDRIEFDFGPTKRHLQPLGLALFGAGVAAAFVGAFVWSEAWSAQAAQAGTLAALDGREAELAATAARPASASAGDLARNRATLRVAHGLQTPWSDLLNALESAPHDSVALLAIEPSIARQLVRLSAEARDPDAMLDYLAALQADARLAQVVLVSHQVQALAPGKPVRFTMQAAWGSPP